MSEKLLAAKSGVGDQLLRCIGKTYENEQDLNVCTGNAVSDIRNTNIASSPRFKMLIWKVTRFPLDALEEQGQTTVFRRRG